MVLGGIPQVIALAIAIYLLKTERRSPSQPGR